MKKVIFSLLILLYSVSTIGAQEDDVVKVKKEYPKTFSTILKDTEREWPGDPEIQEFIIRRQCKAFLSYNKWQYLYATYVRDNKQTMPESTWNNMNINILGRCSRNKYIDGKGCQNLPTNEGLDCSYSILSADWEIVEYLLQKQVEEYKSRND